MVNHRKSWKLRGYGCLLPHFAAFCLLLWCVKFPDVYFERKLVAVALIDFSCLEWARELVPNWLSFKAAHTCFLRCPYFVTFHNENWKSLIRMRTRPLLLQFSKNGCNIHQSFNLYFPMELCDLVKKVNVWYFSITSVNCQPSTMLHATTIRWVLET